MKQGYTHITLVCDRSGSMSIIKDDAEGAVNTFIEEQKAVPGEADLLLVDFDAPSGMTGQEWYTVIYDGNIKTAPKYELKPRGNTALLDAVGQTIVTVGEKLAAMSEDARPEHVVFVVQTDGQENHSRDWKVEALRERIKEQETKWNWQFLFLGMGPDTYAQGHAMGMSNVTRSANTAKGYGSTYNMASQTIGSLRTGKVQDLSGANVAVDDEGNVTSEP
jgi:hypothetical protein